jgi:AraC-like DNA-binding protein
VAVISSFLFLGYSADQLPKHLHFMKAGMSVKQLASMPMAGGGLSRLAAARVRKAGIQLDPLLAGVGLTLHQIDDPDQRISARSQVAFLEAAAEALDDDFLGLSLAEEFDCRDLGLLYYVMASSDALGDAFTRVARYSRITNEAIVLHYREAGEPTLRLSYLGLARHEDRHQMEFLVGAAIRMSWLTGRRLIPRRVSLIHVRAKVTSRFARFFGKEIEFGSKVDEIVFPTGSEKWPLVDADPRLNKILLKVCDQSLDTRRSNAGAFRAKVENIIAPLLPHGHARVEVVAKKLGMSVRTLSRRLAEEGVTFIEVLQQLKATLASRYLEEERLPISKIAWLLGFEEVSSFSHACRRWVGKSPRELRSTATR